MNGEWFDLGNRKVDSGVIYAFGVEDPVSGNWILNVRVSDSGEKIVVIAVASEMAGYLHNQIKRKSVVLNACSCGEHYYHPIGIGYVKGGRFRSKRIVSLDDVPEEIRERFEIKRYEEVSPKSSVSLEGKLVALVKKGDIDKAALLFVLEKICSVFK